MNAGFVARTRLVAPQPLPGPARTQWRGAFNSRGAGCRILERSKRASGRLHGNSPATAPVTGFPETIPRLRRRLHGNSQPPSRDARACARACEGHLLPVTAVTGEVKSLIGLRNGRLQAGNNPQKAVTGAARMPVVWRKIWVLQS